MKIVDKVDYWRYNKDKGGVPINERIKELREALGLSPTEFGERVGLSRGYVWLIECGKRNLASRTASDICRIFGVDEHWLRTGEGEMFRHRDRGDEIADIVSMMLRDEMSPEMEAAVVVLSRASSEQLAAVLNFCRDLLAKYDEIKAAKKDAPD